MPSSIFLLDGSIGEGEGPLFIWIGEAGGIREVVS